MAGIPDSPLAEPFELRHDDACRRRAEQPVNGEARGLGSSAEDWIAPPTLDRLGEARMALDALLVAIEERGFTRRADGLGWRWADWVEVALDPSGFGIAVRYGADALADPDAPVLRPLTTPSWSIERVIHDWIDANRPVRAREAMDPRTRGRLVRAIGQLLARHPAVRAWEQAGQAMLAIPPAVLRLAREIERYRPLASHRQLRAQSLDVAWRHYAALERARRENPALFPLLAAYASEHGLRADIDPVRQLRDEFRFRGLSKAEWARLARDGTGDFEWALQLVGDRVSRLDLVVGLIRFERDLRWSLGDFEPDLRIRWLCEAEPWRCRPELEHAARLHRRSAAPPAEAASIMGLLNHGLDARLVTSTEVLAMPGWRALEARIVEAVLERVGGGATDGPAMLALDGVDRIDLKLTEAAWWRSLEVPANALVARRLRTAGALEAEGHEMCHCIANYGRAVERGRYLAYTIRGPDGRPVATVGFRRRRTPAEPGAPWVIDDLRGIADRAAPRSVGPLVAALLDACNGPGGPPEHLAAPPMAEPPDEPSDEGDGAG